MGIDWRSLLKDGGSRREAELLFRCRPGSLRHEPSPRLPLGIARSGTSLGTPIPLDFSHPIITLFVSAL